MKKFDKNETDEKNLIKNEGGDKKFDRQTKRQENFSPGKSLAHRNRFTKGRGCVIDIISKNICNF